MSIVPSLLNRLLQGSGEYMGYVPGTNESTRINVRPTKANALAYTTGIGATIHFQCVRVYRQLGDCVPNFNTMWIAYLELIKAERLY